MIKIHLNILKLKKKHILLKYNIYVKQMMSLIYVNNII